jgi:starch synthase
VNILFASSEVAPWSKTGGLGDVAAALPRALARRGHDVIVVTPLYGCVDRSNLVPTGETALGAPIVAARAANRLLVAFVEHMGYFGGRAAPYGEHGRDYPDNAHRFHFFCRAIPEVARALAMDRVDILHLNDWQTGLAALEHARRRGLDPGISRSVMTIHNLGYQGLFDARVVDELNLGWEYFTPDGIEFWGRANFLKAGIAFADRITTVSPTYAREIQTYEQGFGLDGLLRARSDRLHGILNGVDTEEWNPATDPRIPARYSADDLSGKAVCRETLCRELGIDGEGKLLLGMVSRIAGQKGFDILLEGIDRLMARPVSLAILGSGDPSLVQALEAARTRWPGRIGLHVGFDEGLAHRVEAGADAFLMPSRYEPCGLNQMYSLRYGTVPIVRRTGGLADTVEESDLGTGFLIPSHHAGELLAAVDRAHAVFADPPRWQALQRRGMAEDHSWDRAAAEYEAVYELALSGG